MLLPNGKRGVNPLLEESLVNLHSLGCQHADIDPGFGIIKTDSQKALPMVLYLDHGAIFGWSGHAQDVAGIDPGMTGD